MAEHHNLYQRAAYYDIALERDVSQEVDFIQAVYHHHQGMELASVLDIGCGPAYHSRLLARRGVQATGLDLRPEMVAFAAEKAATQRLSMDWIAADMRNFHLGQQVDMAICMFDGLDALLTNEDLVAHFCSVAGSLRPGGLYLVDLCHPRETGYDHYADFRYSGERDGVRVEIIWGTNRPRFDLVTGVAHTELEIHVQEGGRRFTIHDSADERVLYPREMALIAALSGSMRVAGFYGDYRLEQPLDDTPASRRMLAVFQKVERD